MSNITIVNHLFVPLRYLQFLRIVRFTSRWAQKTPFLHFCESFRRLATSRFHRFSDVDTVFYLSIYLPASQPASRERALSSLPDQLAKSAGGVRHARQKSQPRLADAPVPKKKVPEWEKPDPDEEHPTKMLPLSVSLASKQSATCLF